MQIYSNLSGAHNALEPRRFYCNRCMKVLIKGPRLYRISWHLISDRLVPLIIIPYHNLCLGVYMVCFMKVNSNNKLKLDMFVPQNMGLPPACKVCMSSTKAMYLQIHSK